MGVVFVYLPIAVIVDTIAIDFESAIDLGFADGGLCVLGVTYDDSNGTGPFGSCYCAGATFFVDGAITVVVFSIANLGRWLRCCTVFPGPTRAGFRTEPAGCLS
jgi:hypothetical protein